MNKVSKVKEGWKQILKNETIVLCHTRNANYVNRIRLSIHEVAKLKSFNSQVHRVNTYTRMMLDESADLDLENCIVEFDCNPFDPSHTALRTFQSGAIASVALVQDFEMAFKGGDKLLDTFLNDLMFSRKNAFDSMIHKNSRKLFCNPPVDKENR